MPPLLHTLLIDFCSICTQYYRIVIERSIAWLVNLNFNYLRKNYANNLRAKMFFVYLRKNYAKDMNEQNYCYKYPHPAVTADCVIFGFDGVGIKVLLIQRGIEPYKGKWAFPGGFMKIDETAEECAQRELEEETGLKNASVEQFYTFSDVGRDPRERVITVAHYALVKLSEVKGGDDAATARWFAMDEVPGLAFDHDRILRMAVNRLKERICFEPIGFELLPAVFTMTELQNLYEAILEVKFDRRNFYNKMLKLGILSEAEPRPEGASRRTPTKYRFNAGKYAELKQKGFRLEF